MSLARRLLLAAALWGLLMLVGGAVALSAIYRTQTLSLLEENLDKTLVDLTRELEFLPDGRVTDQDRDLLQYDPRFQTPLSGQYWAVIATDDSGAPAGAMTSKSLWDGDLPLPDGLVKAALDAPGETHFGTATGPSEETVRVAVRAIRVENRSTPLIIMSAADMTAANQATRRFRNLLLGTMLALFGGVFAAMVAGINFSLRPLQRIEHDIAQIREGNRNRLDGDYPSEVRALTGELNKLLDHNREVVERAQTHVGNLAHALKTPLAVLRNEAKGDSQLDDVVRRQTESMNQNVQHYLKRAQAAARAEALGARTKIKPVLEGLARLMGKLHAPKTVLVQGGETAVFRGDVRDFEEMLGNPMDNACKWAASEVIVRVEAGEGLHIHVDDDGPGLSPQERADALQRGVRLDETIPGTGLGLSIVAELAELHGGSFELGDSPQGGLRASLYFPPV